MMQKVFVGIDVSSEKLDLFVDQPETHLIYRNTPDGWEEIAQYLGQISPERIVLEPTGNYEKGILRTLLSYELPVARVNAARVRAFANALGLKAKNDRIDARVLAIFAKSMTTFVTELPSQALQQLQEVRRYRDFLSDQLVSMKHLKRTSEAAKPLLEKHIFEIQQMLKEIEKQIKTEVESQPALKEQIKTLSTIPGVSFISAVAILTEVPELGLISPKKISALVGVAPYVNESGKFKGRAKIFGGRARARKSLYMPVISAIRFNPQIKAFYQNLKERGKPSKVALTACMRKLLCTMNAMLREQKPWATHDPSPL